jgi:large subunit ribosomal protein L29
MKAQDLRQKDPQELVRLLAEERERLRDLTFRLAGAQLKEVSSVRDTKRNIARILTTMNEKQHHE